MWNRVKKMFKKKKKRDVVISYDGGQVTLKDVGYPMIIERDPDSDLPSNMKIHTKLIGDGDQAGQYLWEINGVMITAIDIIDAQRKYLRIKKTS